MLSQFFSQLHLQEPLWLLAFLPLGLILWLVSRTNPNTSAWSKVIDKNLLPYLLQGKESNVSKLPKWLLILGGLLAIIALADPVWQKVPRPVFQTNSARVIVLDLSNSMLVGDLKPSRLARARFKVEDILSYDDEGQTGLVVFAGDAFTASPLTRDVDTIRNLLQVFTPRLMPSQGSRVDYGLRKAHQLLKQAGVDNGQVLLIADGVSNQSEANKAVNALKADGHTVSVLAVGTKEGGYLRLRNQQVNIKLDADALEEISKKGGGGYHIITSNNTDLNTVLKATVNNNKQNQELTDDFKSADWKSTGPYLLLFLLPIAALAFRKGWLLNIFIAIGLINILFQPHTVYAGIPPAENSIAEDGIAKGAPAALDESLSKPLDQSTGKNIVEEESLSFSDSVNQQWKKLWLNSEQRADIALKKKEFKQASLLSDTPLRKGSANYKGKDYKGALTDFQNAQSADARYNEGNTLAKLKKYKEAIDSYKKALGIEPDMKDAKANIKAIEEFLKRKKQQEKEQKKKDQKKGDKDKKSDKPGEKGEGKEGKEGDKSQKGDGKKDNDKNQFDKANKDLDKKKDKDAKKEASEKQKKAAEEKNAKDKSGKAEQSDDAKQAQKDKDKQEEALKQSKAKAEELSQEEKMAAEQWLRRIPDDPGGLLRRKFKHQYQRNNRKPNDEQPW